MIHVVKSFTLPQSLWFAVPLALVAACGGQSESDGAGSGGTAGTPGGDAGSSGTKGGTSGSSTGGSAASGGTAGSRGGSGGSGALGGNDGGSSAVGGTGLTGGTAGSKGGTAGDAGTAGVGGGCCLAYPACPPGSSEVPLDEPCPVGSSCEDVSICCSTIRCASGMAQCNAFPACDKGDTQLTDGKCPRALGCYTRTLCGNTIHCADDACDPETEYNYHYVAMGDACGLIDYTCPAETEYFGNPCGCGCKQDASCPPAIDCQPGPDPNPSCSDEILAKCPYSPRAL